MHNDVFLSIQPVTDSNRDAVLHLQVTPDQQRHIETTAECLAEAAGEARWHPVALKADGTLVGFAMYGAFPAWITPEAGEQVWLDRLLIDARHQGHGYGERALALLLAHLQAQYGTDTIYLSVYADNDIAIRLYQKYGFAFTGGVDTKGEKVMRWHRVGASSH